MPTYGNTDTLEPALNGQSSHDPMAQVVDVIQSEVNDYLQRLKELNGLPPAEVFMTLSAISARLAEIRNRLVRVDNRRFQALRTKEVDPLIDEVDRQFKFHSRLQAVRSSEWEITRGAPC